MSFQAYLDNIRKKTGKSPDNFRALARKKGLTTYSEIFSWLKSDFELGHGHANAMAHVILHTHVDTSSTEEKVARHFQGAKESWRKPFDKLVKKVEGFGPGISLAPTSSYISILRDGAKIGVVQISRDRMEIGIKLRGIPPTARFQESGAWNAMVTHRVAISDPREIDTEVMSWLRNAYKKAV